MSADSLRGVAAALALAAGLSGCFESDPAPLATAPAGSCDAIALADEVGVRCNSAASDACPSGAICVSYVDGQSRCLQPCEPGGCDDMCGEGACIPLASADGSSFTADIDGDAQPDRVGVCELTAGPFERCGSTEAVSCRPGSICLAARAGDGDGNCVPLCDTLGGRCGNVQGAEVGCTLTLPATADSIELHACTIDCETDADCPLPWVCFQLSGGGLCLEP